MKKEGTEYDLGDLVREVATRTGQSEADVKNVLSTAFQVIPESLAEEEKHRVELHNVGVFSLKFRKARIYPWGESPDHWQIRFKSSPKFADVIWNTTGVFAK